MTGNAGKLRRLAEDEVLQALVEHRAVPAGLSGTRERAMLAFSSYGARICVDVAPGLLPALEPLLPVPRRALPLPAKVDRTYSLVDSGSALQVLQDGQPVASLATTAEALDDLATRAGFAVAMCARGFLVVHAGVVEWEGRAIVVPGRTMTGKSSLVMAMVSAGARYYSDEFAVLDMQGRVHAWPRRPNLRPGYAIPMVGGTYPGLEQGEGLPSRSVGVVAVTRYREGADWQPSPRSRGQGALALLDNTVMARHLPELALAVAARAVESAVVVDSDRGDAVTTAARLLRWAQQHQAGADDVARGGDR